MNEYNIDIRDLNSESDVEQKVIWPLLTNAEPIGFGYEKEEIQTKFNLRKLEIDKGAKSQLYYPDYLISVNGFPSIIIEAKKPNEDLAEAFRQASLYASEINRFFEGGINPCKLIIACDGLKLVAGFWDEAKFKFEIETNSWLPTDKDFSILTENFSKSNLVKSVLESKKNIRRNVQFKKPLNLIGGNSIQNKQTNNTFGETISIQYQHLFNPTTEDEKIDIVKNAYVKVYKHESHLNPIEKLIRKKIHPSFINSTEINDNYNPIEISNRLRNAKKYNNQVLLLVGSVGSGKSTFMTYLKEVAIEAKISNSLFWVTLNLNNAPVNKNEIYTWVKSSIISQIKEKFQHIDFDSYEIITKLYSEHLLKFEKIASVLLSKDSENYKNQLYEEIKKLQENIDLTLSALISEFINANGNELIIVLDNCDKRNLEEQLLMFEVANWIKDSIKSIVFLPLRDTTYDHYRNEKPLDTVIKDLTFRITPASLEKVIYSRIKYASRWALKSSDRSYFLSNNIKVSYPAEDELYYLKSILSSLFQNNFFKKLLIGLTGSDIRKGIEIFTDFCKSGHITDNDIFKIKQSKGDFKLPNHVISKVFLRGNKVYYNDESSKIKNLFYSDPSDTIPNPFTRVSILKWLHLHYRIKGESGMQGYHSSQKLLNYLIGLGHEQKRIELEIVNLIRQKLIISETQDSTNYQSNELISISTSGIVHLDILWNLDYLSACSEDTWFENVEIATNIAKNMGGEGRLSHLSLQNTLLHSEYFLDYLSNYFNKYFKVYYNFIDDNLDSNPIDMDRYNSIISNSKSKIKTDINVEIEPGTKMKCKVVNIQYYGLILELGETKQAGFISASNINDKDFESNYKLYDELELIIVKFNQTHKKYDLKFE